LAFSVQPLSLVRVVFEAFVELQPWWSTLPWNMILGGSCIFLIGLIVQDIYNPGSWLWANWHPLTDAFDCEVSISELGPPARIQATLHLTFRRTINAPRLVIAAYPNVPSGQTVPPAIVRFPDFGPVHKDEHRLFELATIPIPHPGCEPLHSRWGPPTDKLVPVIGGANYVVHVELTGTFPPQRLKILAASRSYGGAMATANFFAFTERDPMLYLRN
jgi:hypothetical protein